MATCSDCYGDCKDKCTGHCYTTCTGGCKHTGTTSDPCGACGNKDCSQNCDNCHNHCGTNCTDGCANDCTTSCDSSCYGGCDGSCRSTCRSTCKGKCKEKCDTGCSTEALQNLYLSLKLDEYVKYEDVYNLVKALENELTRRGKESLIVPLDFSQYTVAEYEIAETIYNYFNNMDKGSVVEKEEQYELMHKNVFEAYIKTVKDLHDVNLNG